MKQVTQCDKVDAFPNQRIAEVLEFLIVEVTFKASQSYHHCDIIRVIIIYVEICTPGRLNNYSILFVVYLHQQKL